MSGWWILPAVLIGGALWTALFAVAFGAAAPAFIPMSDLKEPAMLDILDLLAKWAVAPLIGALWYLDRRLNAHDLKHMEHRSAIEVLKAGHEAQAAASAASYAALTANQDRILNKLDEIDTFLRRD